MVAIFKGDSTKGNSKRREKIRSLVMNGDSKKEYTLEGTPVIAIFKGSEKLISLSPKFWEVV